MSIGKYGSEMVKYAAKHKNYPKSFVNCEKVFNFAAER
jgi:hypothetical protein